MSDYKEYRKKPVVVEAMQFDGSMASASAVYEWLATSMDTTDPENYVVSSIDISGATLTLDSNFGTTVVKVGDYVIKGPGGDFYPCPAESFSELYEEV